MSGRRRGVGARAVPWGVNGLALAVVLETRPSRDFDPPDPLL